MTFYSQKIIIKPIVSSKPHWTSANINKPRKVNTLFLNLCPSEEQMCLEIASLTSFIQPLWSRFTRTPSTSSTPGCQLHPESLGLSIFSPTCEVSKSHRVTATTRISKELCHLQVHNTGKQGHWRHWHLPYGSDLRANAKILVNLPGMAAGPHNRCLDAGMGFSLANYLLVC